MIAFYIFVWQYIAYSFWELPGLLKSFPALLCVGFIALHVPPVVWLLLAFSWILK